MTSYPCDKYEQITPSYLLSVNYYFSSVTISFRYFLSRSAKNKGNMKATDTTFELKDIDIKVFESALGS